MVFSSIIFLFFFLPVVLLVHALLPWRWRNLFLLLASLFFYAWGETVYVLVMIASTLMNYAFGLWIERRGKERSRLLCAVAVTLNLLLLMAFKYANFIVDNLNVLLDLAGVNPIPLEPVHLPIGISFFTFQALSYVVDVYRGHVKAQPSFVNIALYIALFPQLIAGPIVRYIDVAKEIVSRKVTGADFASGVRIFLVGLGKKVLIANIVAEQADLIFAIPYAELPTPAAWLGLFFFMMQLYFDFSGYSDMAIGLGRMLGFHFLINFNYPYIAKSLTEFWQRWHISLSTWFRDYLFTPLGGYKCSKVRAYFNLMTVFILCGLWHGASWNFFFFGLYQACFLVFERLIRAKRRPFFQGITGNLYLLFIIYTTMVFFRSDNLAHSGHFFAAMFGAGAPDGSHYPLAMYLPPQVILASLAGVIGSAPFIPWLDEKLFRSGQSASAALNVARQTALLAGLVAILALCMIKLAAGTHNPFIYFRF